MRRTPLVRKTGLRSSGPPKRTVWTTKKKRARLKQVGRVVKRDRKKQLVDGPLVDHVRTLPCLVSGEYGVDPHHIRPGHPRRDWLRDVDGNLVGGVVPLARRYHTAGDDAVQSYRFGLAAWEAKFIPGRSLATEAKRIAEESGLEPPAAFFV